MYIKKNLRGSALQKYLLTIELNDIQKDVIIGSLLGDATMGLRLGQPVYALKFEQCIKNQGYIKHLYEIFLPFVGTIPSIRYIDKEKTRQAISFRTYRHKSLIFYFNLFYRVIEIKQEDGSFIKKSFKIVPKNIHKFLTPRALAYWFMDDGSYSIKKSTGIKRYDLSTHGFQKHECENLCNALLINFNIRANIIKDKHKFRIFLNLTSCPIFKDIISPYIHKDFLYKL